MPNPSTTLSLTSSAPAAAVQSVANRVHVIGPGSQGPVNTPTPIDRISNLATFGWGPGVSLSGEVYTEAATNRKETGLPVFFTRSLTSVPSTLGPITKTPKSGPVLFTVFGQILLNSSVDDDGDLTFQAKIPGASLTVQTGMALAASVTNGTAVLLTIPAATLASVVVAFYSGADPGATAARNVFSIRQEGTGGSDAGTTLATTSADNGSLTFTPPDEGYEVRVVRAGNNTVLSAAYAGPDSKQLTINLATDADGTSTSTANDVAGLPAISGGPIDVTPGGTGLGLAGVQSTFQALQFGSTAAVVGSGTPTDRYLLQVRCARGGALGSSTVQFAADEPNPEIRSKFGSGNASLWFLAKRKGLAVELIQQTTASASLTHTFEDGLLSVKLGTDGSSVPNTTATALRAYLLGFAKILSAFRFNFETGDGSSVMASAAKVSLTDPTINWSGPLLVPPSGIVALKDGRLDTGVSFTFTGLLETDDLWEAETTLPSSSIADMQAAFAAIEADNLHIGAIVVYASSLERAGAALADGDIQAALQTRQLVGMFTIRGIGEGVANETHDAWQLDSELDWLGFVSVRGLLSKVAGEYLHVDPYTGRNMRRYLLFAAAGRAASGPYHQDLGRVLEVAGSGSIKRCLGLYHDEAATVGLHDQGFITATSAIERPGAKFITASPTCADQSDSAYALIEFPRVILVGLRIAKLRAFDLRNSVFPTITAPDDSGAPAGALTFAAAASMEEYLGKGVQEEFERIKSDGQPSTGPLGEGEKYVEVLRINNFASDKTIHFRVNARLLVPAQFISIEGNAILAG